VEPQSILLGGTRRGLLARLWRLADASKARLDDPARTTAGATVGRIDQEIDADAIA
jgi:hypothetical protein